jgi:hypothetical protein
MRQMGFIMPLAREEKIIDRFADNNSRGNYIKKDLWPEGQTPNFQPHQCKPYIEWHFPKELKTKAIQIICSGGAYKTNNTDGFEVAPIRRYLNEKGMTVVFITHHMDECIDADRLIVMSKGRVVADGKPAEVFANVELMESEGLTVPETTRLIHDLRRAGVDISGEALDSAACAKLIAAALN